MATPFTAPIPPQSEQALLSRAQLLAGQTLGQLAEQYGIAVPANLNRHKGWPGQLLEYVLGASAGSKPEPDFVNLGIELKTIPINFHAKPLETTFVCVAPLTGLNGISWQNSHLKHKLARVLWVPIIAEKSLTVADRILATPFIWSPDAEEETLMAADWQELTDMIALGRVEQINGKHGNVLQLRPKAANSKVKTEAFNHLGQPFLTLPRGFYLRTKFTQAILNKHLLINPPPDSF